MPRGGRGCRGAILFKAGPSVPFSQLVRNIMAVAPDKDVVVKSGRSEQEEEPPDFEVVRRCVCLAEESSKKRHITVVDTTGVGFALVNPKRDDHWLARPARFH